MGQTLYYIHHIQVFIIPPKRGMCQRSLQKIWPDWKPKKRIHETQKIAFVRPL
jgi:hypothetical protein